MQKIHWLQILKEIMIASVVSGIVMAPWLIRAYLWTGNPVFPFLSKIFGGLDPDRTARFFGESQGVTPSHWWTWPALFWMVTFEGLSGLSYMGPIFLSLLPLGLFGLTSKPFFTEAPTKAAFLLSLLGMVCIAYVNRLTRYWIPFLAVAHISMLILAWRFVDSNKVVLFIFKIILIGCVCINSLSAFVVAFERYAPWPVLLGKEPIHEYQSYFHPGLNPYPPVKMAVWAKENLPKNSKILIVGDEKVGNIEVPFLTSGVYDRPILSVWAQQAGSAKNLRTLFSEQGITHILINPYEGKRLLGYGIAEFSDEEIAVVSQFWDRYVRYLHAENIPEKMMNPKPMLVLYRVFGEGDIPSGPPPHNFIFWLFEESKVPLENSEAAKNKLLLMEALVHKFPHIKTFEQRLMELRTPVRAE